MKPGFESVVARIDPQRCIGCARCIEACPFDAIIGAPQRMHTVIADECIGCELCIAPCPVDCIELVRAAPTAPPLREKTIAARQQRAQRDERLARKERVSVAAAVRPDLHALVAAAVQRAGERSEGKQAGPQHAESVDAATRRNGSMQRDDRTTAEHEPGT